MLEILVINEYEVRFSLTDFTRSFAMEACYTSPQELLALSSFGCTPPWNHLSFKLMSCEEPFKGEIALILPKPRIALNIDLKIDEVAKREVV